MKKVVFIGNRCNVFDVLIRQTHLIIIKKIFVLRNSLLHEKLREMNIEYELFDITKEDKRSIVDYLQREDFDILISNGCPFILPIKVFKHEHPDALFINTHPSYLPHLKGKTPLNGVFMLDYKFIGATTHYMDEGIDTGDIIAQERVELTSDIDQGLVYMISFDLEGRVFRKAFELLVANNFVYKGLKQSDGGSYFNRESSIFSVDFENDMTEAIIKKINSLGLITMGNKVTINQQIYNLHHAEAIVNPYLLDKYVRCTPGTMLYTYSDKLLIKTIDGIIKATYVYG